MRQFAMKDKTQRSMLVAMVVLAATSVATAGVAEFKVRYMEGEVLPGQAAGVQYLDWIALTDNGTFLFGGDTTATGSDEFIYSGTLSPFALTLEAQEGSPDGGTPSANFGPFDQAIDLNAAGTAAFVSNANGSLDTIYAGGAKYVREGETLADETVNSLHHAQIDGAGTPWFIADIGADSATDKALFQGTLMLFREGDTLTTSSGPITVDTLVISESTSGAKLRVNDAKDYILQIDAGAGTLPDDAYIIFNGEPVAREGDAFGTLGVYDFFQQCGVTENGRWWILAEFNDFNGPNAIILENQILLQTGDTVGPGLTVNSIQVASVNNNGDYLARVRMDGAPSVDTDVALVYNGQIIAREGFPLNDNYNWGEQIGFVGDVALNNHGEFVLIANLVPAAGGDVLESLITGVIVDVPGDCTGDGVVDLDDFPTIAGCLTGPGAGPAGAACACADFDGDDDVDLVDFHELQMAFGQP